MARDRCLMAKKMFVQAVYQMRPATDSSFVCQGEQ
jgi:hypothetical protein